MSVGFVLSSIQPVSNNQLRCVVARVPINDAEYWLCGDRNNFVHSFTSSSNGFIRTNSFPAHNGWLATIAYVPPSTWFPNGAVLTGSQDRTVKAWELSAFVANGDPIGPIVTLPHSGEVCFVTATEDGRILSCSWDSVCRVWTGPTGPLLLRHEQHAIWAATAIPDGYVTLGADKTIRVWSLAGALVKTIENAHADVLRSCRFLPGRGVLLTVANDGVLKQWRVNGTSIEQGKAVTVSDRYLYSLAVIDDDTYVISSEDRCAYVVSAVTQSVVDVLPMTGSVWGVDVLGNGDVVTVCADGYARVFTQAGERRAEADVESAYLMGLAELTFNDPELQNVNPLDLPDLTALAAEPPVAGRATLIRDGGDQVIVIWSNGYGKWLRLGKVTRTKGAQREKVFDETGRAWDFCFTVNMEDGRNLPLYVNYDTNQYEAAEKFIRKYKLPTYYQDQVARFIYTQRQPYKVEMDTRKSTRTVHSDTFPLTSPNYLSEIQTGPALRKLRTFNDVPALVLSEEQFQLLEASTCPEWWLLVSDIAQKWPVSRTWPLMDVLRARILDATAPAFIPAAGLIAIITKIADAPIDDFAILNLGRLLSNIWKNYTGEVFESLDVDTIFANLSLQFTAFSQRTQLSLSNAFMNYTVTFSRREAPAAGFMDTLLRVLEGPVDDETLFRLAYAVGTAAVYSSAALEKLRLRPDIIDEKRTSATSKTAPVLAALVALLSA
jgi:hypothetical protein